MDTLKVSLLKLVPALTLVGFVGCKSNVNRDLSEEQRADLNQGPNLHKLESYEGGTKEKESQAIQEATQIAMDSFKDEKRAGLRDQHSRASGCVKAKFEISDVPNDFRVGLFSKAKTYQSWVRYSPATADVQAPDGKGVYGMAIKLMGVEGKKILEGQENETTQDFLLANYPSFLVSSVKEYVGLQRRNFLEIAKALPKLGIMTGQKVSDLAETNYFSMSSFALGENSAVKYKIVPCQKVTPSPLPKDPSDDFLTKKLADRLSNNSICYKFLAQKYIDERSTPVENPKVEWKDTGFVELATITIPSQQFNSESQKAFCENLTLTPWHSLAEHRPLGRLNRARKVVYAAVSERRHSDRAQDKRLPEPTVNDQF